MSRLDDLLLLERAGRLPPDLQADLDVLRRAGRVPPLAEETEEPSTEPSPFREAAATAVEIGAPIVGGLVGAATPAGPLGALAGSAAGGAAGRYVAEKIRGREVTGRELLASGAVAAIPGGGAAKATRAGASILKRALAYGAEGAVIGAGSTAVSAAIEEGRLPTTGELAKGAAAGAATGGVLGAAFGRRAPKIAADKVSDDAARATAAVSQAEAGAPPTSTPEPPPAGQRRIVLPGETSSAGARFTLEETKIPGLFKVIKDGDPFENLQVSVDLSEDGSTILLRSISRGDEDVFGRRLGTDTAGRLRPALGAGAIRDLGRQLFLKHPATNQLQFERVTGRRATEYTRSVSRQQLFGGDDIAPRIFGPEGKILPVAAPILEQRMSIPLADALQKDVLTHAQGVATALEKQAPDVKQQRFFRQLNRAIADGLFDPQETVAQLHKNGWTMKQFFEAEVAGTFSQFEKGASEAGQLLNRLSVEKKRVMAALAADPETRKIVDQLAVAGGVDNPLYRLWREVVDLDDVSRATAIGQMATAHRNAVTQAARLTLEVPVDALRRVFERMGLGAERPAGNPLATLYGIASSLRPKNTERVLSLLEGIGPEGEVMARRLFGTNLSETSFAPGAKTGRPIRGLFGRMRRTAAEGRAERRMIKATLGPVADAATAYSALQENFFRRAAFQSRLMQHAQTKGLSWARVQTDPGLLSPDDFEDALTHALQTTFAAEPTGKLGKMFLRGMRAGQPITTMFAAYPRYMTNFGKFFLDFNPAGSLRLFSAGVRKQRGAEVLAKSMIGTTLLGAGVALRMSDRAGERWYEMASDDGKRQNMIGLAGPFLPYLFLGELVARRLRDEPTPRPISIEDYMQGTAGLRISPGTKALFDMLSDRKDVPEALEAAVGEWLGRFTVPLRTVKDFSAAFGNESERLYLDPRDVVELPGDRRTRILNPTIQNVPEAGEKMGRAAGVSPVTGKDKASEATAKRQLIGTTTRTPTDLGIELDRLGIDEYDLIQPSGVPKVDRAVARRAGTMAQAVAPKLLASPAYQKATPAVQTLIWNRIYTKLAKKARENLKKTNPELEAARKLHGKASEVEQAVLKERGLDLEKIAEGLAKRAPER